MYTVYLRTNLVNGKQYVGQTENFELREKSWRCLKQNYGNLFLSEDREKYGLDNFKTEILAEVETNKDAWELEKHYIMELKTKFPNGYNMGDGGETNQGFRHSEESKKKMSEIKKGKKHTEEEKRKISEAISGEKHPLYGKHHSEEAKKKMSDAKPQKKVLQIDKNTNEVIAEFSSAMEIQRQFGFNHSNIARCCLNKPHYNTAYGFIWRFANENG